jgi:hypothetical protein
MTAIGTLSTEKLAAVDFFCIDWKSNAIQV